MNNVRIIPSELSGEVRIPSSKSVGHRYIICAALSEECSVIDNITFSQDIYATIDAMRALGADISVEEEKNRVVVQGIKGDKVNEAFIDCHESGSTLRFLIPIAAVKSHKSILRGKGRLVSRPLDIYYDIFHEKNIKYINENGELPLTVLGELKSGEYRVKGNVSSQFISGLMFALPLLKGNSKIIITTELESKGYVDLTIDALRKYSVHIQNENYRVFNIKGNQKYISKDLSVEGDFSQVAFWMAAGALGEKAICSNLDMSSLQGDKVILNIIRDMGAQIKLHKDRIEVSKSQLLGRTIDASQCPDLVPILAVLGAVSMGETRIINAERLRIKESDRLRAVTEELNKIGAHIIELKDGLIISGTNSLKGGKVKSWNDHRIAMAMAVASIKCSEPVIIEGADAVNKSYPDFWKDFMSLGGDISEWNVGE